MHLYVKDFKVGDTILVSANPGYVGWSSFRVRPIKCRITKVRCEVEEDPNSKIHSLDVTTLEPSANTNCDNPNSEDSVEQRAGELPSPKGVGFFLHRKNLLASFTPASRGSFSRSFDSGGSRRI